MDIFWQTVLWSQFGATLSMFEHVLRACPEELWNYRIWKTTDGRPEFSEFWYVAYHALFYLDLYTVGALEGFAPPAPFTLGELEPGVFPERTYSKAELLSYLDYCRNQCRTTLLGMTDEKARERCGIPWYRELSRFELHVDNMRHVQEHCAQLGLVLG